MISETVYIWRYDISRKNLARYRLKYRNSANNLPQETNSSIVTCKLWRLSYNWSILDAPSRRHWTLSFFRDHAMASCPKEHPSLSARAHTSRNLSEYFRVSSSADLSFHPYSCVVKTTVSVHTFTYHYNTFYKTVIQRDEGNESNGLVLCLGIIVD